MAQFLTETGGGVDDQVHLFLGQDEVLAAEDYQVDIAFLEVPNAFSIKIGSGATALSLMKKYPANTPFKLKIGPVISFSGRTDGFQRANQQATELSIIGRDAMATLVDDSIEHDKTWNQATYEELTKYAIEGAGIKGYSLVFDAAAHRSAVTGQPITEDRTISVVQPAIPDYTPSKANENLIAKLAGQPLPFPDVPPTPDTVIEKNITVITGFRADKPIFFKAGERWYHALKKELDRGGVFLRASVDPEGIDEFVYLLSAPNGAQPPLYGLVNARGAPNNNNLVTTYQPKLRGVTTDRHARYITYGRAGGGDTTRTRVKGEFADPEMQALGYTKRDVKVDETVKSDKHAEYLSRKRCAEARRKDRSFSYSVKGHTAPLIKSPDRRAVIVPDTTVYLRDDEHGMEGVFWIERVTYTGSSDHGRYTEMTLMAPEDLVFGDGDFSRTVKNKKSIMGRKGGPI